MAVEDGTSMEPPSEPIAYTTPFRFKGSHSSVDDGHARKRRRTSPARPTHDGHKSRRHDRQHKHRRHEKETRHEKSTKPAPFEDSEAAFRESLFDAMADDEGADYWQEVYGQPVHIYSDTREGPDGELERMTDDEYVEHVRARMWEKTHQHIIEERKRREEAARQQRDKQAKAQADASRFQRQMEESLQRGSRRRQKKAWKEAYETYAKRWEKLLTIASTSAKSEPKSEIDASIPWPVRSGTAGDVGAEAVEDFLANTEEYADMSEKPTARLKAERVRWHPDKMQQRMGAQRLDEETLRRVTAVFQIIDDLWAQTKR